MKELNYFDLIYQYTNADISEEDKIAFESELLSDSKLYEEFELFKKVQGQFNDDELMNFNKLLHEASRNKVVKRSNNKKLLGGVSNIKLFYLLFIISIAVFMFLLYIVYFK
ncbi:MAG: hypothetical protein QM503_03175 [Bacteroidota bacterium]